jgi:hypothetical protein
MQSSPFEPSFREKQVAVSMMAHIARGDDDAVALSLIAVDDESEQLRPMAIIEALLEWLAMGIEDSDQAAALFCQQAQELAAREQAA